MEEDHVFTFKERRFNGQKDAFLNVKRICAGGSWTHHSLNSKSKGPFSSFDPGSPPSAASLYCSICDLCKYVQKDTINSDGQRTATLIFSKPLVINGIFSIRMTQISDSSGGISHLQFSIYSIHRYGD